MLKKSDKYCPFCNKPWFMNVGIKNRLRKYKKTDVKCIKCGEWFEVIDRPEEKKIDREEREYQELSLC